jgi:hypothetical protein
MSKQPDHNAHLVAYLRHRIKGLRLNRLIGEVLWEMSVEEAEREFEAPRMSAKDRSVREELLSTDSARWVLPKPRDD